MSRSLHNSPGFEDFSDWGDADHNAPEKFIANPTRRRQILPRRTGTRIEETARVTDAVERSIRARIPASEMGGILDNIGLPVSGINLSYSNSGVIGNADAEILVSLAAKHRPTEEYIAQLRDELPKEFPGTAFFFQPADIVSQILNFGLPAHIDIQLVGSDVTHNFAIASSMAGKIRSVPGAVDVHVYQLLDQPRIQFNVDRVRTQQVGLNERDVASNALVSLSSSFQTSPNFWLSQNGVAYNIAVQTPQYKLDSIDALRNMPINSPTAPAPAATPTGKLLPGSSRGRQRPRPRC